MKRCATWALALAFVGAASPNGLAGSRHYGNGPAMTAFGPVYNPTMSPEYRKARGNWAVYEQLMQQKWNAQEQQQVLAAQKQWAAYLKANPDVQKQLVNQQLQYQQMLLKQQRDLMGPTRRHKHPHKADVPATKDSTPTTKATPTPTHVAGAPETPARDKAKPAKP